MSNAPSTPPEQVDQRGTIPSHEFVQIAASVFERVSIGAMITDAEGRIVSVNNAFSAFTGYSAGEVIGKKPSLLQSGRQDARFYAEMWQTLRQRGHWSGIVWNRKKNGAHYAELLNISSIYSED
ncbi:MAG: PAS domain S-box protein, partial [Rhodocyclaceae bacterium]|nr:PAS domain S-box protein [Rhodocyclaceae bacterium]